MTELLANAPAEDAGHATASWYRFQYAVTAIECLRVLQSGMGGVVVEWHTDFVRRYDSSDPDLLVSVKHKSLDQGAWSLADLSAEALSTLFTRWKALGSRDRCRIVSNAGLKTGENQARQLADAIETGDIASLDSFARKLAPRFSSSKEEALTFLRGLTIQCVGADESAIAGHVIDRYCRPILLELGLRPSMARGVYDAIFSAIYGVASGYSPDAAPSIDPWTSWNDEQLQARTIDYRALVQILATLGLTVDEGARAARRTGASSDTVMLRKLKRGGLGPSVESGAPRLRANWYSIESRFREDIPAGSADEIIRLRRLVLEKAMAAESETRGPGAYGPAMHVALARELSMTDPHTSLPIDYVDLLGCAYQLTDECQVWWSDRFDPLASEQAKS